MASIKIITPAAGSPVPANFDGQVVVALENSDWTNMAKSIRATINDHLGNKVTEATASMNSGQARIPITYPPAGKYTLICQAIGLLGWVTAMDTREFNSEVLPPPSSSL